MTVATVSTGEAAKKLGIDARTLRRWADRGEIRAIRLTPRSPRRLLVEDVERLAARARGAAA